MKRFFVGLLTSVFKPRVGDFIPLVGDLCVLIESLNLVAFLGLFFAAGKGAGFVPSFSSVLAPALPLTPRSMDTLIDCCFLAAEVKLNFEAKALIELELAN